MTERISTLQEFYDDDRPWREVDANDGFLLATAAHPITLATLRAAADKLGNQLLIAPAYAEPWSEFVRLHPEYSGDGTAGNPELAFSLLGYGELPSVAAFEEIASRTPCPLTVSIEHSNQQREDWGRSALIKEISQDKPSYRWRRPEDGKVIVYETSGLDEESTERLREIRNLVVEQRRLLGLSPAEVQQEVSATAREQRQANTARPAVNLIDPTTGTVYTREALLRLIAKQDRAEFRRLLFSPDGHPIPGAKEAIDRILGVKPRPQVGHSVRVKI